MYCEKQQQIGLSVIPLLKRKTLIFLWWYRVQWRLSIQSSLRCLGVEAVAVMREKLHCARST